MTLDQESPGLRPGGATKAVLLWSFFWGGNEGHAQL